MDIDAYLKERNMKITKARRSILEIMVHNESAVTADQIFEQCKTQHISMDLSTVYRTLEVFQEKQVVDKFDLGHGKYNYMLKERGHKHIIQCDLCHKEIEIDCPMPQFEELIKEKTGFTLTEEHLTLKGICEQCTKQKPDHREHIEP